ncbi:MAG: hypothetical protein WBK55_08570 [Alphaproteobacteria bacterium]
MRQLLLGFLMLMMLMPSLACAMPMCTDEAQATKAERPCADHTSHHGDKKSGQSGKVSLLVDCMGVDLQKADVTSLEKPDLKFSFVVYALADETVSDFITHTDAGTIRGPPPDWPALSRTQPSILLTTQRFRI